MADSDTLLCALIQLQNDLQAALDAEDWELLSSLNTKVRPTVDPVMAALEHGQIDAAVVTRKLQELNDFVARADAAATKARDEAKASLQDVNQNRSAARAYRNISSN